MTAEKGNKVYTITEQEKSRYQGDGFDILEDGKVIAYGKGKTVPYEDYMKVKEELDALKEKLGAMNEEPEDLKKASKTAAKK